jgi:hypothetical protein
MWTHRSSRVRAAGVGGRSLSIRAGQADSTDRPASKPCKTGIPRRTEERTQAFETGGAVSARCREAKVVFGQKAHGEAKIGSTAGDGRRSVRPIAAIATPPPPLETMIGLAPRSGSSSPWPRPTQPACRPARSPRSSLGASPPAGPTGTDRVTSAEVRRALASPELRRAPARAASRLAYKRAGG